MEHPESQVCSVFTSDEHFPTSSLTVQVKQIKFDLILRFGLFVFFFNLFLKS